MKKVLLALLSLGLLFGTAQAQTIRVAGGSVGQELELSRQLAQMYMEQNPDVTVESHSDAGFQTDDRFAQYLQIFEAQSPDIDVMQARHHLARSACRTPRQPSTTTRAYARDRRPALPRYCRGEHGKRSTRRSFPGLQTRGILYYRTDLLEEYGFDGPPQTWTEVRGDVEYYSRGRAPR